MFFMDITPGMREEMQEYACWMAPLNAETDYTVFHALKTSYGVNGGFWFWSQEFIDWLEEEFGSEGNRWQFFAGNMIIAFRSKDDAAYVRLKWDSSIS